MRSTIANSGGAGANIGESIESPALHISDEYLLTNGSYVSRDTYSDLFPLIRHTYTVPSLSIRSPINYSTNYTVPRHFDVFAIAQQHKYKPFDNNTSMLGMFAHECDIIFNSNLTYWTKIDAVENSGTPQRLREFTRRSFTFSRTGQIAILTSDDGVIMERRTQTDTWSTIANHNETLRCITSGSGNSDHVLACGVGGAIYSHNWSGFSKLNELDSVFTGDDDSHFCAHENGQWIIFGRSTSAGGSVVCTSNSNSPSEGWTTQQITGDLQYTYAITVLVWCESLSKYFLLSDGILYSSTNLRHWMLEQNFDNPDIVMLDWTGKPEDGGMGLMVQASYSQRRDYQWYVENSDPNNDRLGYVQLTEETDSQTWLSLNKLFSYVNHDLRNHGLETVNKIIPAFNSPLMFCEVIGLNKQEVVQYVIPFNVMTHYQLPNMGRSKTGDGNRDLNYIHLKAK